MASRLRGMSRKSVVRWYDWGLQSWANSRADTSAQLGDRLCPVQMSVWTLWWKLCHFRKFCTFSHAKSISHTSGFITAKDENRCYICLTGIHGIFFKKSFISSKCSYFHCEDRISPAKNFSWWTHLIKLKHPKHDQREQLLWTKNMLVLCDLWHCRGPTHKSTSHMLDSGTICWFFKSVGCSSILAAR